MRLVAWNSCQKFAANFSHLLELDFDVAVVAECSPLDPLVTDGREITSLFTRPAPPSEKWLGVLARAPWTVVPYSVSFPQLPWLLPALVKGPLDFTLLAVWPVAFPGAPSYTKQLSQVLAEAFPEDTSPVVLAGDLNAPIAGSTSAHLRNVDRLDELGLRSGYLSSRGITAEEAHSVTSGTGATEPTYFQHRRRENGFHIDHVFAPKSWRVNSFHPGSYDQWVAAGRSDHVPLIIDLDG